MSKSIFFKISFILILFFIIYWFFIFFLVKKLPFSVRIPVATPSANPSLGSRVPMQTNQLRQKRVQQKKSAKFSSLYSFHEIEVLVQKNRTLIGMCFLKNQAFADSKVKILIQWSGTGVFEQIKLKPDPGSEVRACLQNMIQQWKLNRHPGMQPFSYEGFLMLSSRLSGDF